MGKGHVGVPDGVGRELGGTWSRYIFFICTELLKNE